MNREHAKKLVEALQFLAAVTENAYLFSVSETIEPSEKLQNAEEEFGLAHDIVEQVIKDLPGVHPDFSEIIRECDREASERGRIWGEQRAEKIALLRLAGDDTPEEQIP